MRIPGPINDTDVTASLDDDSNTLYISFSGYEENYANQKMAKANVKESSNVKNVTARMIFNRDSEHADFDYDFDFANLTVSHS
mgnify:FL=1